MQRGPRELRGPIRVRRLGASVYNGTGHSFLPLPFQVVREETKWSQYRTSSQPAVEALPPATPTMDVCQKHRFWLQLKMEGRNMKMNRSHAGDLMAEPNVTG
ncbi:uncharacterized protein LOC117264085 [Epinephelus lanceolatus]